MDTAFQPLDPTPGKMAGHGMVGAARVGIRGAGNRPIVLVVDDIALNRLVLKAMLSPLGVCVLEAASGEEALRLVRSSPPDMIFMDLFMPGMDGFETVARIRAETDHGEAIPIVAATADQSHASREKALAVGMIDYVCKPLDHARILDLVRTHLGAAGADIRG